MSGVVHLHIEDGITKANNFALLPHACSRFNSTQLMRIVLLSIVNNEHTRSLYQIQAIATHLNILIRMRLI